MNANKNFGINVNALRKHYKISREKLAGLADMSLCSVAHIEQGRANTTLESASNIADALGIDLPLLIMDNLHRKATLGLRTKTLNVHTLEVGQVALIMKSNAGLHVFPIGDSFSNQLDFFSFLNINNLGQKELRSALIESQDLYDYAINNL